MIYDLELARLDGRPERLDTYAGKVVLAVNVASKCGFTPQYAGLQALQDQYADRGFTVLGFPCNQFFHQEPGNAEQIQEFCSINYGVKFPLFEKLDVAFAEIDRSATPESIDGFKAEMERVGVKGSVDRIAGATHGFAMADLAMYDREAAEQHFEKTIELWRRNLQRQPVSA